MTWFLIGLTTVLGYVFGVRAGYNLAMQDMVRITTLMTKKVRTEDLYPPKDPS